MFKLRLGEQFPIFCTIIIFVVSGFESPLTTRGNCVPIIVNNGKRLGWAFVKIFEYIVHLTPPSGISQPFAEPNCAPLCETLKFRRHNHVFH